MKPLSMITHLKSNIKRLAPTILVLGMEFAALTFMISIGIGQIYAIKYNLSVYTDKCLLVMVDKNIDREGLSKAKGDINDIDGVTDVIEGNVVNVNVMLPIMYSGVPFMRLHEEDMNKVLEEYKLNLVEGNLPKADDEIVLTREGMNTLDLKINDYVGSNYRNEFSLDYNYKVVGIVEGEYPIFLAKYSEEKYTKNLIVQVDDSKREAVVEKLNNLGNGIVKVDDFNRIQEFVDDVKAMLVRLGLLAVGIFSVGILITVVSLSKTVISASSEEYSLLRAIGYNMKFIKKRIAGELGFLIGGATIVGVLLGTLINVVFKALYCTPRGIPYIDFSLTLIIIPTVVAVILYLLNKISISNKVKHMDFMGDLEI